jgi:predicted DNA-binding ribbon-helix-helix protein
MSTLSVRLPESVHRKLKQMADKEGISMNQLISLAVSEKLSSLLTVDYLNERANQAIPDNFKKLLDTVPNIEPESHDKL